MPGPGPRPWPAVRFAPAHHTLRRFQGNPTYQRPILRMSLSMFFGGNLLNSSHDAEEIIVMG